MENSELLRRLSDLKARCERADILTATPFLSPAEQAEALAVSRQENLRSAGRIEFGGGIIRLLAEAFCDSPYVNRQNWEETLHDLLELFYSFKNETWDAVSDRDLIAFMRQAFNGSCCGCLELLADRELPAFSEQIHKGGKL